MKAILIDDERHALLQLQRVLDKEPDIEVIGSYRAASEGLAHLSRERAELVFLDIEMPGVNGLEVAETISALDRNVRVIFVTAYSSYALEAFEVNALDYVLKPIDPLRFAKTLERIRLPFESSAATQRDEDSPVRQEVEMLGQLSMGGSVVKITFKWRTLKSKELFAYLLQHRGQWLTRDLLMEEIWPAFDLDKALVHLHTSVYQVRRMLRETGLDAKLEYSLESYRLHGDGLGTDAERFEQALDAAADGRLNEQEAVEAWELYRGHYLDKEDYPWASPLREKLLQGYVALTLQLTESEREHGSVESALRRARRACELYPYSERLTRELLACQAAIGDMEGLRGSYAAFCRMYEEEWGNEPSAEFQAYVRQLIDRMNGTS